MRTGRTGAVFLLLLALAPLPGTAGSLPIESRREQEPWAVRSAVEAMVGQPVSLRVPRREGSSIRWFRIVPDTSRAYNNAVWPWDPGAYRWIGYAKIGYARAEMVEQRDLWEITLDPADPKWSRGLTPPGSYWFQAEVRTPRGQEASPGLEMNDQRGLSPRVLRVTFREGDDLLGHLTGYFHVPGVFGSVPYQVGNFIAVDCADVLMAAWSRSRGKPVERDYNVVTVVQEFPLAAKTVVAKGRTSSPLRWGKDVRKGDLIAVKYPGWKQFGHIGALYQDRNGNGMLDADDLVLHAGPLPLHLSPLGEGAFDGEVRVLRPPPAKKAPRERGAF
jgi:hypothetical protein